MANLTDEEVKEFFEEKYTKSLVKYADCIVKLKAAIDALNKDIAGLNSVSEDQKSLVENGDGSVTKSDKPVKAEKQEEAYGIPLMYDSGASWKNKIVRILKIENRAMSKDEIANFIGTQEDRKDIDTIKGKLSGEFHKLLTSGDLVKSKHKGIKMKGYFYGKSDWLLKDKEWKPEYAPIITDQTSDIWAE